MKTFATLAVTIFLAGCLSTADPPAGVKDMFPAGPQEVVYSWPDPIVTDSTGKVLEGHPLATDPDLPRFVPRLIPHAGAEPSIGVSRKGNVFVTAYDELYKSMDKGGAWQKVWDFRTPNWPTTHDRFATADPMFWADDATDRIFVQHMYPGTFCTYLAYSDDEGATWTDQTLPVAPGMQACATPFNDHQKLITAPYGPQSPISPERSQLGRLGPWGRMTYMCYAKAVPAGPPDGVPDPAAGTYCSMSYNSGATWTQEVKVWPGERCPAQNGHPTFYPDGTVLLPRSGCDSRREARVALSEDNGQTWRAAEYSGEEKIGQSELDADVTVTKDNTAYMVIRGGTGFGPGQMPNRENESASSQKTYLLRSEDKFRTWAGPFRVAPPDHVMDVFTVMASGSDGRLAIAYLGTRTPQIDNLRPHSPSFAISTTEWHLFVSHTLNADEANPIFVTQQVTPNEDPVQVGCVWLEGGSGGPMMCRNMLDFNDMDIDADGRVYIAFTDGCVPRNGCTADTWSAAGQSHDDEITVAVQTSGWSLFEDKKLDLLPWEFPRPFNETGRVVRGG